MKTTLIAFVVLAASVFCLMGWIYESHPEAFQDALADITSDPNSTRTLLEKAQKQNNDLSAANQTLSAKNQLLQGENGDLKTTNASLKTTIEDLTVTIDKLKAVQPVPEVAASSIPKIFIPPSPLPEKPNWLWITTDGKVYKNVVVEKAEADCVTILDDEGGALIPLANLPPDLQKQFNYDPLLAAAAARSRERARLDALGEEQAPAAPAANQISLPVIPPPDKKVPLDVLARIDFLQRDIAEKKKSIDHDYQYALSHGTAIPPEGPYRRIIAADQAELDALHVLTNGH